MDEGVVAGHAPVVVKPHDHAVVIGQVLGRVGRKVAPGRNLAVADRKEEVAVLVEGQPAAVVAVAPGHGLEDLVHKGEAIVFEGAPDHGRRAHSPQTLHGLGVADVDQPVRCEIGVGDNVHQSALAAGDDRGHPGDGVGKEFAVADDAQPSLPLGHEDVPAGEERDRPGDHESVGHGDHAVVVQRGALEVRLGANGGVERRESRDGDQDGQGSNHHYSPIPAGLGVRDAHRNGYPP